MSEKKRQLIGIELIKRGIVTERDVKIALQEQKRYPYKKIGEILYELKVCNSKKLIEAIGEVVGEKGIILKEDDIKINIFDYISLEMAKRNKVIPFEVEDGKIKVCFSDTNNQRKVEAIRLLMLSKGLKMEKYLTFESIIDELLKNLGDDNNRNDESIIREENGMQKINFIIKTAIEKGASDIHLKSEQKPMYRKTRTLIEMSEASVLKDNDLYDIYGCLINGDLEKDKIFNETRKLDITYDYDRYRILVNLSYANGVPTCTMKLVKKDLLQYKELEMPEVVRKMTYQEQGLILVAGKEKSGKTTTVNVLINNINETQNKKIIVLEKRIEYRHISRNSMVVQKEVGEDGDFLTYSDGIKNALREDCDVLVVGEINDKETIEAVMQAVESGCLVIGTLNTNSCAGAISKLINFYDEIEQNQIKNLLSKLLKVVISQKLSIEKNGTVKMIPEVLVVDNKISKIIKKESNSAFDTEIEIKSFQGKADLLKETGMKIGIDIGGSHIGIGLVDDNGCILQKEEKFIEDKTNIEEKIEKFIIETVTKMTSTNKVKMIGIAVPGTVSENKIIKAVNLGVENYDLAGKIEKALKIPVKLKNDAKCAALAEQKYGELEPYENSIFLCIGTGIGGAVIYNGKLLEPKGVPGFEFSHIVIQKNGNLCNCGKRGCFETYASLKRFKERVAKEFDIDTLDGDVIREFIKKNSDNSTLKYMINNYVEDLSIGISNIINIFEPEAICIGGSFAEYKDILYEPLKKALLQGNLLFNPRSDIIIKLAKLKNDAGISGATIYQGGINEESKLLYTRM